jgi:site-specific DNA recombinase
VRLIFRLAREGDGTSGPMGVKSITNHLNAAGICTRDGGRWGIDAVYKVLTRTTYIGRHRLTGICFCAGCGMTMTLRTSKS